jgi:predicted AAA+ superfamily ATPase
MKAFKLYHLDVGLLRAMCDLPSAVIISGTRVFEEFKGALAEQFVLTELLAHASGQGFARRYGLSEETTYTTHERLFTRSIHYWTSDATAEVDFIFSDGTDIYPVEVKASENLRARSLKIYREKYAPRLAVRASMANLRMEDGLLNVPLALLFNLPGYL